MLAFWSFHFEYIPLIVELVDLLAANLALRMVLSDMVQLGHDTRLPIPSFAPLYRPFRLAFFCLSIRVGHFDNARFSLPFDLTRFTPGPIRLPAKPCRS